jgi:hypothetical protein
MHLRCWSGTGLDAKVLGMMSSLVETALDKTKLKFYFTGTLSSTYWHL